jgi:hypothetical protein
MENNIRIVRLQNGEDIVGYVTSKEDGHHEIVEPMTVGVEYKNREAGLVMRHWLPIQLVKKNETILADKDIICMFEPADDFCEYYENTVEKIRDLIKAKNLVDNFTDEEVNNIMDAFEELEDDNEHTLH